MGYFSGEKRDERSRIIGNLKMRHTAMVNNRSGFSLMELMVTIAIIGILAAVVTPNMIAWRNNAQLNAATRRLKGDIEGTRMAAIKSNLPADVIFNAPTSYDIQRRRVIPGGVGLSPVVTRQLEPGTTIAFNAGGQITFNNRGMTGNNGTVTIRRADGDARQIVVSVVGSSVIQ